MPPTICVHLPSDLDGSGQVPHLNAAIAVPREEVPSRTGADATGPLALVDHKCRDGGAVDRTDLTHSVWTKVKVHVEFPITHRSITDCPRFTLKRTYVGIG